MADLFMKPQKGEPSYSREELGVNNSEIYNHHTFQNHTLEVLAHMTFFKYPHQEALVVETFLKRATTICL